MITTNEELRSLCIKHHLFTSGSNSQYEKFFYINKNMNPSITEMAYILWICSDCSLEQATLLLEEAQRDHMAKINPDVFKIAEHFTAVYGDSKADLNKCFNWLLNFLAANDMTLSELKDYCQENSAELIREIFN